MSIKVIVAGGRRFNNYALLEEKLDFYLKRHVGLGTPITIVSGGARGADTLGERYARERSHGLEIFPADWSRYGRSAGYIRNEQMAKYATHLVAFWDGQSRGTSHMINLAKKHNLNVRTVRY